MKQPLGPDISIDYGKLRPRPAALVPYETELIRDLVGVNSRLRAVVLEAPPGFGKTLVLEAIFRQLEMQSVSCVWLSLDEADSTLERFIHLLVAACTRVFSEFVVPEDLQSAPKTSAGRLVASMLSSYLGRMEIFIDNLEFCRDPLLGRFLDQLITLSSSGRFWISTAHRVELDWTRHVTEGLVRYHQALDLCFTKSDSKNFLKERGQTQLSENEINQIQLRTLGWPLAVSLMATILNGDRRSLALITQFSGRDEGLASFLRSHLPDRVGKELYTFLLSIAWFHPITVELCKHALKAPGARRLIDQLLRENCYLTPMDRDARCFRLHPLVRDFLIHEAENELQPETVAKVLQRAVEWSKRKGDTSASVEYALASQCPELITEILHEIAPAWVGQKGGLISYIKWVELAKQAGATLTVESEYWYLWALLFARQHQAAYKQSELLWERSLKDQSLASSPAQIAFRRRYEELRILIDIFRDETGEAGKKAVKWLEDSTAQNDISIATVACCVAINATANFDFKTARDAIHTAQAGCISANTDYGTAWVAVLSAQIDFYEGEYSHCYDALNHSLQKAVDGLGAESNVVSTTQLLLSSCLLQMGMREEARKYLLPGITCMPSHGVSETTFCGIETALELWDPSEDSPYSPSCLERLIDTYPPPMNVVYRCFLVRRLLRLERTDEAILQAELIGIDFRLPNQNPQAPSAFVQELVRMTHLEYMVSKGMNRQAAALAESLLRAAEEHKRRGVAVELEVTLAILAFRSENLTQTLRHIHRAIRMAAQRGILSPFLLRLGLLRTIFSQFKEKDWGFADRDERALFQKLSDTDPTFESVAIPSAIATGEAASGCLTAREIDLLRLADAGLSNIQIAERSDIALTTVKWHFSNIYSKLDVRSRSAATAKVRALKLL